MIGKDTHAFGIPGPLVALVAVMAPIAWIVMAGAPNLGFRDWPSGPPPRQGGTVFIAPKAGLTSPPGVAGPVTRAHSRAAAAPGGTGQSSRGRPEDRVTRGATPAPSPAPVSGTASPVNGQTGQNGAGGQSQKDQTKADKKQAKADAKAEKQQAKAEAKSAKQDARAAKKAAKSKD